MFSTRSLGSGTEATCKVLNIQLQITGPETWGLVPQKHSGLCVQNQTEIPAVPFTRWVTLAKSPPAPHLESRDEASALFPGCCWIAKARTHQGRLSAPAGLRPCLVTWLVALLTGQKASLIHSPSLLLRPGVQCRRFAASVCRSSSE